MRKSQRICRWVTAAGWAALVISQGAGAQQQSSSQQSPTLHGGVSYADQSSQTCEEQNANNVYLGMNPFVCHGESAPTDSQGKCSLNIGTVWKQVGNTCYYCSPINPPIQGMIVPMDQVGAAESQGWGCGANQTDVCTAICYGGKTFSPLPGTAVAGGGPGLPVTPAPRQGGPPEGYAPILARPAASATWPAPTHACRKGRAATTIARMVPERICHRDVCARKLASKQPRLRMYPASLLGRTRRPLRPMCATPWDFRLDSRPAWSARP